MLWDAILALIFTANSIALTRNTVLFPELNSEVYSITRYI